MFKDLNPILHSQLRLAIMAILISVKQADFNHLKDKTQSTSGNLSIQLQKLKEAGYITIEKSFKDNFPLTTCSITNEGIKAFEEYVKDLKQYIQVKK